MHHTRRVLIATACLMALAPRIGRAALIQGGSDILTAAYANQLESWLGQGPIELTNIFDYKYNGSVTSNFGDLFHAAVDGRGATFVVIKSEIYNYLTAEVAPAEVFGGYNPQSWSSIGDYNYTLSDAERTAFLFNLTSLEKQSQKLSTSIYGAQVGMYQTYNYPHYGLAFGGGHDLYVFQELGGQFDGGLTNYSYGDGFVSDSIASLGGADLGFAGLSRISDLEVFTFAPAESVVATPEPSSLALLGLGAAVFGGKVSRRRRASQAKEPAALPC